MTGEPVDHRAARRPAAYRRIAAKVAAGTQAAREILALAPCDLRSATRTVREFQQEISAAQEAPA